LVTSSKKKFEKAAVTEGYSRLAQVFPALIGQVKEEVKRRAEIRKIGILALEVGARWFIKHTPSVLNYPVF
jgi:hypothetical protein